MFTGLPVRYWESEIVALTLESKKRIVVEVAEVAASAHSAVSAEYRGLSVEDMTNLRVKARETGVYLRVVKNTLTRRAVKDTEFECLSPDLTGPLVLAFSREDPGSAARLFKEFGKENESLKVRSIAIGGQLFDASELGRLASLPTRDQAISMLMAVMKAPVEKFVRTLAEPHAKLVRTAAAIRDRKQSAA